MCHPLTSVRSEHSVWRLYLRSWCDFFNVPNGITLVAAPVSNFTFTRVSLHLMTACHLPAFSMFTMKSMSRKNWSSSFSELGLHISAKLFRPPHFRHLFPNAGHLFGRCCLPHIPHLMRSVFLCWFIALAGFGLCLTRDLELSSQITLRMRSNVNRNVYNASYKRYTGTEQQGQDCAYL